MSPTNRIYTTLLSASLAAVLAFTSAASFALEDDSKLKTYTDPVTGELRVAPKLLSEMTEQEIAMLSKEEHAQLKEIEEQVKMEAKKTE